jgi:hypothetical protein
MDGNLHQAFKQMLDALDMQWSKVTHLQTLAIETTSQHGLNRAEIALMSKHAVSALDDCYITQLLPITSKVMAGFEKDILLNPHRGRHKPTPISQDKHAST